jgi:hypothetical protein
MRCSARCGWVWCRALLALGFGLALRRWLPHHLFVFILGRGFFGTALCTAAVGALSSWLHGVPRGLAEDDVMLGRWLAAWGDAWLCGMITAIFVAFRPQWLATYTDRLYLPADARAEPGDPMTPAALLRRRMAGPPGPGRLLPHLPPAGVDRDDLQPHLAARARARAPLPHQPLRPALQRGLRQQPAEGRPGRPQAGRQPVPGQRRRLPPACHAARRTSTTATA